VTDEQITATNQAERLRVMIAALSDSGQGCFSKESLRAILAHIDAQAAEIARLREEPTLTITRAQYDEFVESAENHTILWTDTLALIGVYVAPCQTKIDV
jgi:hypothetical protein